MSCMEHRGDFLGRPGPKEGKRWDKPGRLMRLNADRREEARREDRLADKLRGITPNVHLHLRRPKIT